MIKPIETIKFDDPVKKEFLKQKLSKAPCRHLKGVTDIDMIDDVNDEIITVTVCDQCGRVLTDDDLSYRDHLINKFK